MEDFPYLKGTTHTDNENGLEYRVIDIRKHRSRKGYQIVVDRKCLIGGVTDTIYALDAAAMTDRGTYRTHRAVCSSLIGSSSRVQA